MRVSVSECECVLVYFLTVHMAGRGCGKVLRVKVLVSLVAHHLCRIIAQDPPDPMRDKITVKYLKIYI